MKETIRGPITDPASGWRVIGDTDHLNRLAANPPLVMEMVPDDLDYPEVRGQLVGPGPIRHTYRERDSRWLRHQWFHQERLIEGPLMRRTCYQARLIPEGAGVIPEITLEVEATNALTGLPVYATARRGMRAWKAELDTLPAPGEGAVQPARRQLPAPVRDALQRWRGASDADVVDLTARWLQHARTSQLREIRPYALADAWGLDRKRVLESLLDGAQAGALELYWTLRCPRCDAGVGGGASLSNLADQADCPSCRIHFGPDLAETVEVLLAAHPAIRPPPAERFCTLFPVDRPDVLLLMTIDPGATEQHVVPLPPGRWFLGAGGERPDLELRTRRGAARDLDWRPDAGRGPIDVAPGDLALTLHNPTEGRIRVQLAGEIDTEDRVSAAELSTLPAYRKRFGAEVLAPDVRIGVKAMAILFTDLTGSAALYHEQGDAGAFQLVHEHFGVLDAVVERHGGVRVKTIGDALMAAFTDPGPAVAAALEMQRRFTEWADGLAMEHPPGLKVGVHFGPCMAVHTDQAGLDFFGGTVNLAARCEGQAGRGDVIWTSAVQDDAAVARAVEAWGGAVEPFTAQVKGLPDARSLYRARTLHPR